MNFRLLVCFPFSYRKKKRYCEETSRTDGNGKFWMEVAQPTTWSAAFSPNSLICWISNWCHSAFDLELTQTVFADLNFVYTTARNVINVGTNWFELALVWACLMIANWTFNWSSLLNVFISDQLHRCCHWQWKAFWLTHLSHNNNIVFNWQKENNSISLIKMFFIEPGGRSTRSRARATHRDKLSPSDSRHVMEAFN